MSKIVTGMNRTVRGDGYTVSGMNATVIGDHCVVSGMNATVRGDYNRVTGMNATVHGDHNTVDGMNAEVFGSDNDVTGMGARLNGKEIEQSGDGGGISCINSVGNISFGTGGMILSGGSGSSLCVRGSDIIQNGEVVARIPASRNSLSIMNGIVVVDGKQFYPPVTPPRAAPAALAAPAPLFNMLSLEGNAVEAPNDTPDDKLCVICTDNLKNVLLLPCKHIAYCVECARNEQLSDECAICRVKYTSAMVVFS